MTDHTTGSAPRQHRRASHTTRSRRHQFSAFSRGSVMLGAIHIGGMLAGILAADRMKAPGSRWSAIAGFGIATGIGEAIWREYVERQRQAEATRERE